MDKFPFKYCHKNLPEQTQDKEMVVSSSVTEICNYFSSSTILTLISLETFLLQLNPCNSNHLFT